MKLREIFPKYKLKKYDGHIGLEIETETELETDYPKNFFIPDGADDKGHPQFKVPIINMKAVLDGSLRNFGREFILTQPLSFYGFVETMNSFERETRTVKFLKDAPATSVHVHLNFCEEEPLTLASFVTTWVLVENLMVEFSGPTRRSNLFARPIRVSEYSLNHYLKLLENLRDGVPNAIFFQENEVKYGALNIATLGKYGSLEIRCFRGTTDVKEIVQWVALLDRIYQYAKSGVTPRDIVLEASQNMEFLTNVFGVYSELLSFPSSKDLLQRNLWYVLELAQIDDWVDFGGKYKRKEKRGETVGAMGNDPLTAPPGWTTNDMTSILSPNTEEPESDYLGFDSDPDYIEDDGVS